MATLTKKDIEEGKKLLSILDSLNPVSRIMAITYIDALGDQQRAQEINEREENYEVTTSEVPKANNEKKEMV